jgi:hypothetical protein
LRDTRKPSRIGRAVSAALRETRYTFGLLSREVEKKGIDDSAEFAADARQGRCSAACPDEQ